MQASPVCLLVTYYQYFHEVLLALIKGGTFVLLYDERNPVLYRSNASIERGLIPFLTQFVREEQCARVQSVTIQRIVNAVEAPGHHDVWIGESKRKFGIATDVVV